jgi:hypothetical protein
LEIIHDFFLLFVCGTTIFLCKDKDHILTYQRLTSFVVLLVYLGFLDTRISLGPGLFPIPLVLRYRVYLWVKVLSNLNCSFPSCYLLHWCCLTTWSRGSYKTPTLRIPIHEREVYERFYEASKSSISKCSSLENKKKIRESLSYKLNKFHNNNIIKSLYFVFTKTIYTLENKNPNGSILVG